MSTFYPYQWDLNYANPVVFNEMMYNFLYLANRGVDVVRVDAATYIWKYNPASNNGTLSDPRQRVREGSGFLRKIRKYRIFSLKIFHKPSQSCCRMTALPRQCIF